MRSNLLYFRKFYLKKGFGLLRLGKSLKSMIWILLVYMFFGLIWIVKNLFD